MSECPSAMLRLNSRFSAIEAVMVMRAGCFVIRPRKGK